MTAKRPKPHFSIKKSNPWMENLSIVMQIGLTMVGCIIFCFLIGRYLDVQLGGRGLFSVIFIVLGVIGGGVVVYRQIMEMLKPDSAETNHRHGTD